jgi:glutathionylspermidine synthase
MELPSSRLHKSRPRLVLSYLLSSVSRDILVQIAALPTTTAVWKHLETSFASQSRARVINTRMALATTQNGSSSAAEYVSKMKTLADEMASTGKKLDDEELISYILAGLDYEYNSLVSSIAARVEPVTLGDMYS